MNKSEEKGLKQTNKNPKPKTQNKQIIKESLVIFLSEGVAAIFRSANQKLIDMVIQTIHE